MEPPAVTVTLWVVTAVELHSIRKWTFFDLVFNKRTVQSLVGNFGYEKMIQAKMIRRIVEIKALERLLGWI